MASQRQARTGGAAPGPIKTTTIKTGTPAARTKGGKAAAAGAKIVAKFGVIALKPACANA